MLRFISTIILCGVLCSTFIDYGANDCFFLLFPFTVSVGIAGLLAFALSVTKENRFRFTLPDGLITGGVIYYLVRYDYQLHLADWKVIYAALLLLLWYIVRIIFSSPQVSKKMVAVGITGIGCLLAGWGLLQLYGFCHSNHFLYRITGPFFNPGPYSGYLAMLLPVCLHYLLLAKGWQRYCWWGAFALMLCIIPASMSRSAWVAIVVGLLWVLGMHKNWWTAFRNYAKQMPRKAVGYVTSVCVLAALVCVLLFQLKADSARGRLFIWKNTCTAIAEQPLIGYGPGSFQMVYGKVQAAYFAAGKGTVDEKRVAGYAEYTFNEYLQSLVEGGGILLLFILSFGILVFRQGIAHKRYDFCGALFSLTVFAFSSYPLQILPFGIAGVVFSAACISKEEVACASEEEKEKQADGKKNLLALALSVLLCGGAGIGIYKLRNLGELGEQWYKANTLSYSQAYDAASMGYERLYSRLNYHPDFLKSYAGSLYSEGRPLDACKILERAKQVSCNFDIWNIQGRYYQSAGYYRSAEHCFEQSLLLAPERLYPYYLLAKLYVEPKFLNQEKAKQMATIVMTKSPKVHSKAIEEMRKEMKQLLSRYKQTNY